MRTIINPDKYYNHYIYAVKVPKLVFGFCEHYEYRYFKFIEDAKNCKARYKNSEIMRVLPFK